MKKAAESRGADEDPISGTLGIDSGRGVVSMRVCWLKLGGSAKKESGWSRGSK